MSGFETRASSGGSLRLAPLALSAAFVLLDGLPALTNWLVDLEFGLFLIPIFFVALHADSDFAPVWVLLLGLLNDLLSNAPIGFWGILFCLIYVLSRGQKQGLQNAQIGSYWVSFIVMVAITYLAGYLIAAIRDDMEISAGIYFLSAMVTGLCFPLVYWPLTRLPTDDYGQARERG